jgi:predicted MFS family arabinose efflux permease
MAVLALYLIDVAHFTAQQAGGLWSWVGFLTVSVRVTVVGPLSKHLGESRLIQLGLMCDFIALTAFPFVSNLLLAYVATGLMSIGSSFIFPPLASLTSRSAEAEARGATLGGVQLFGGAGKVIGPVWAGFAFQSVGTLMPFLIGAAMMMCAFLLTARVGQSTSATGVAQAATQ